MKCTRLQLRFLLLSAACLLAGAAMVQAGTSSPKDQGRRHTATSDAEKALNKVLRLSEKDNNLLEFVLQTPQYKPKADKGYARSFTKRLLTDMAALEKNAVQENCQGKYIKGDLCGVDYNPLTCAQDTSDAPYLYQTESSTKGKAVISYKWPGAADETATSEMLQEGGG